MKSSLPKNIRRYLSRFVMRKRLAALIRAIGRATSVAVLLAGVCMVIDRLWWFDAHRRMQMRWVVVALPAAMVLVALVRIISRRNDWLKTAAIIERKIPAMDERLVTVVSQHRLPEEERSSRALLSEMEAQTLEIVRRHRIWKISRVLPAFGAFLPGIILLGIGQFLLKKPDLQGQLLLARFVDPRGNHPAPVQRVELEVAPGNLNLSLGKQLRVLAKVTGAPLQTPELVIKEPPRVITMAATGDGFAADVVPVDHDLDYSVRLGELASPEYHVHLLAAPSIVEMRAHYEFAPALKIAARDEIAQKIEALSGTRVTLSVRASQPITAGQVNLNGNVIELAPTAEPNVRTVTFGIDSSGFLTVQVKNADGLDASAGPIAVVSQVDSPPAVAVIEPAADLQVAPFEIVKFKCTASDDLGVESLTLHVTQGNTSRDIPLTLENAKTEIDLAGVGAKAGDVLTAQAIAKDRAGQVAKSAVRKIVVAANGAGAEAALGKDILPAEAQLRMLAEDARKRIEKLREGKEANALRESNAQLTQIAERAVRMRMRFTDEAAGSESAAVLSSLRGAHYDATYVELAATALRKALVDPGAKVETLRALADEMLARVVDLQKPEHAAWSAQMVPQAKRWTQAISMKTPIVPLSELLSLTAAHEQACDDADPQRVVEFYLLSRAAQAVAGQEKVPANFVEDFGLIITSGAGVGEARARMTQVASSVPASAEETLAQKTLQNPPAVVTQIDAMLKTKAAPAKWDAVNAARLDLLQRVVKGCAICQAAVGQLENVSKVVRDARVAIDQAEVARKALRESSADDYLAAYNEAAAQKKLEDAAKARVADAIKVFKSEGVGLTEYAPACDTIGAAVMEQANAAMKFDPAATDVAAKNAISVIDKAKEQLSALATRVRKTDPLTAGYAELSSDANMAIEDLTRARVRQMHLALTAQLHQQMPHSESPGRPHAAPVAAGFDDALQAYFDGLAHLQSAAEKSQ